MSLQNMTQQITDITGTNYLLFHQQLMTLYRESNQVMIKDNHIYFLTTQHQHEVTIHPDKIIKKTKNNHIFQGYSPMLAHVKITTISTQHDLKIIIQQGQQQYEVKLTEKSKTSR